MKIFHLLEDVVEEKSQFQEFLGFFDKLWSNPFIKIFVSTLMFLLIWWITSFMIKRFKKRLMKKTKDKMLTSVLFGIIYWGSRAALIIAYAGTVGVDTAGLAALVASAGVAIGLALQGSLGNLAGGIVILLTRPFKFGDYIVASDVEGTVEDIRLFYTYLVTPDNKVVLIPNGTLANTIITNVTSKDIRRLDFSFQISFEDDLDKVINRIEEVCLEHSLVLKDPKPCVKLIKKEQGIITLSSRSWVKTSEFWDVYFDLFKKINDELIIMNVTIPNQQIDIHNK